MTKTVKIDFVSDVACPWCVVGLGGLEAALERVGDLVDAKIHFQPFELNPNMPPEGQNRIEHVAQKYGSTREQMDASRQMIRDRAAAVGFTMAFDENSRIHNTFDAHRLLHWAGLVGKQAALKHALFEANFTANENIADPEVLVRAAMKAGLDPQAAHEVLTSGRYASEVRDAERAWQAAGINSVPAVVINDRYLISGGQPAEYFEQALRQIATQD
ncbi:DsbA family oxidoreductase [Caulobacter sp. UNC279MFTsu5.1]|uniref:DsbA family oxidoreductase n=1 Tax=Caulobacter sp. UNC279MFTsu5.1 TaxID=1502775 RepID=UPI0008E1CB64|nr:DsbA family oxidoreductase [Caulobacter sp. UNC279MFTsu5.1]SFI51496.1 Predicted dithiol-disulfide isomerase, DsbA family [Caulobacter sp. UNC279MFTsu5.1]